MTQATQTEELKKRFIQFLHENKAYDSFMNGLKNARGILGEVAFEEIQIECRIAPQRYVLHAFVWIETPEGHQFWSTLNKKWQTFCGINN